ncbi:MAG: xylulokinase [Bilifractor sp.]|jgi:xylulokinase
MRKLLCLDVGTTSVKAALFDENLRLLKVVIREYKLETPRTGYVEMEPLLYWESAVEGIRQVIRETGTDPGEVAAITCTTQGETLIPVDIRGNALHKAIVWLDSRAREESGTIAEKFDATAFYAKTGIPEVNGYCPISKLLWIRNHLPEVYEKTEKFLLLEDYLVFKLTGRFVTNPGIMCTTGYFDIEKSAIWTEILDRCGLNPSKIPEVLPCGECVDTLSDSACEALGLTDQTVVSTGAMDQITGAIGAGNFDEGMVSETTGTAMVIAATTEHPALSRPSPVSVYTHACSGKYLYIDVRQTAGMVLKWFRDEFCRDLPEETSYQEMSRMAEAVPPLSRGVSMYPHLTGIQTPVLNENARGVFFGLGLDTGRDCLIRALMESIGYSLRESLELMGLKPVLLTSLGGGSKSDVWNQIKADICNLRIRTPSVTEAASLGAAILGGAACGIFPDIETPVRKISFRKQYSPEQEYLSAYEDGYQRYRKMYERFAPLFNKN